MENFLFELHMHTDEVSRCGKVPAREGIRIYKKLGYSGVCITDHFTETYFESLGDLTWREKADVFLSGYREAFDEGKKCGIHVMLGMEYCLPDTCDDILVYGFDEKLIYQNEELYKMKEQELGRFARDNNLLLIQAHPFRIQITKTYDSIVHGFEAFNGNPRHNSMNPRAQAHAESFGGVIISGSDFHQVQDAGTGGVYLPGLPKDSFDLADLLREIKTPALVRNDR